MRFSLSDIPDIGNGTVRVQIRRTQSEVVVKTASKKLRCWGLAKNTAQLRTLFALANLMIVKKALLA
jgi:IS5 family transposase